MEEASFNIDLFQSLISQGLIFRISFNFKIKNGAIHIELSKRDLANMLISISMPSLKYLNLNLGLMLRDRQGNIKNLRLLLPENLPNASIQ